MNEQLIVDNFKRMGARAKLVIAPRRSPRSKPLSIDILNDRHGEYFSINADPNMGLDVVDVRPKDRHLLLLIREPGKRLHAPDTKSKLLCGHDERHWFVASIPDSRGVRNVVAAKEALKPTPIKELESGLRGEFSKRQQRKNAVFQRQGEWFFVPDPPNWEPNGFVLRNEPIRRERGKPHVCEYLAKCAATVEYKSPLLPDILTEVQRNKLIRNEPDLANITWYRRQGQSSIHARGKITHADHATIHLDGWHRIYMNTENETPARHYIDFCD